MVLKKRQGIEALQPSNSSITEGAWISFRTSLTETVWIAAKGQNNSSSRLQLKN